jgi:serine/threonine-protein kinase
MRYRLIERIGNGGMAEVFRANAEGPHGFERTVVVKRILPSMSRAPEFVRMFVDEAKISARLCHPNIAQLYDFAEQDGTLLLVMEMVAGRDLGAVLTRLSARGRAVPPLIAAEIARQCCLALDYAHHLTDTDGTALGIVHRDVTPSNVMISWDGTVKLLDFGIARAARELRSTATVAGMVKGKTAYVAPEQIAGATADARVDLFALGAVLHEALSGTRLFAAATDFATLRNIMELPIAPPSLTRPDVDPALDRIVLRALERKPEQRFASAREMEAALAAHLAPARDTRAALCSFMEELFDRGRAQPARIASANTIMLDPAEVLSAGPAATPGTARPPRPPPPPAAARPRWIIGRTRRRALLGAISFAAALLLFVGPMVVVRARTASGRGTAATERVEITLDSIPQAAEVARTPDGPAIGETPLLLDLPRGRSAVMLWIRKPGFDPLPFKVIPTESRAVLADLRAQWARQSVLR